MTCHHINAKTVAGYGLVLLAALQGHAVAQSPEPRLDTSQLYADVHFHASNYAMQGIPLKEYAERYMGGNLQQIVRSTIMPIPLQQRWDGFELYQAPGPGNQMYGPNYYIGPKADLYYYSFVDAMFAREYERLPPQYQEKLDVMITAFNPMDVYASQHIKRAVLSFPGVFAGVGEFTIHKELVSSKLAGETVEQTKAPSVPLPPDAGDGSKVSLYSESLEYLFKTIEEIGLVAILHNDMYRVEVNYQGELEHAYPDQDYVEGLKHVCGHAPKARVVWAHTGLGRFVKPTQDHITRVKKVLDACPSWSTDISWDLVQDYMLHPEPGMPSRQDWLNFFKEYQNRILWGSDVVIFTRNRFESTPPTSVTPGGLMSPEQYHADLSKMRDFLGELPVEVGNKIRYENYLGLFNRAKFSVRAWERENAGLNIWDIPTPVHP
ncbi:hypothetical protein MTR80_14355 [Alcaligenes aquatilis]|uniref:Amidohydrolase n=1 Tax=Alcaligenes aquatilis TaxID=323284 RepID=A0ABY4NFA1_9BURK|nr:hypothetical protein [Alcaligenes aquatilis]UQN35466.1 hypothetical protein MTR80_14355 [Alcaligenes aquatilis]